MPFFSPSLPPSFPPSLPPSLLSPQNEVWINLHMTEEAAKSKLKGLEEGAK
jgi:hypothetical protein